MAMRDVLRFVPMACAHFARHGSLPLKERHFFARSGRLRLRYIGLVGVGALSLVLSGLSVSPTHDIQIASAQAGVAKLAALAPAAGGPLSAGLKLVPLAPNKPVPVHPAAYSKKLVVQSGDTLSNLMVNASLSSGEAASAIKALKGHIDPRTLRAGQKITVRYKWNAAQGKRFDAMEFEPTPLTRIVLRQGAGGAFKAEKLEKQVQSERRAARAQVKSSLYGALARADVPDSMIAELIKVFSYTVDFQRDIRSGDEVEILYNIERTADNRYVRGKKLVYAMLNVRGKPHYVFNFDKSKGGDQYFDDKGRPIRKALLRTPVDGARVTSGFGMRKHPLLGYSKMHKGVDFGAPTGTPIFAAGDGKIVRAGWVRGYGKYVKVQHNGTYATAYAHMSKILVKNGQRVRQGQVIGRVGTTGRSTGPHLHFEVIKNGKQINPAKTTSLSVGSKLTGNVMARFKQAKASARANMDQILAKTHNVAYTPGR